MEKETKKIASLVDLFDWFKSQCYMVIDVRTINTDGSIKIEREIHVGKTTIARRPDNPCCFLVDGEKLLRSLISPYFAYHYQVEAPNRLWLLAISWFLCSQHLEPIGDNPPVEDSEGF